MCENCKKYFGFDEAIKRLKVGKKVKRKDWGGFWFIADAAFCAEINKNGMGFFQCTEYKMNPMIVAKLKDYGGYAPATPYQWDLLAVDWEEVE